MVIKLLNKIVLLGYFIIKLRLCYNGKYSLVEYLNINLLI